MTLPSGTQVVLDAGSGIRLVGAHLDLEPGQTVHLFLTHLHMDHVEGMGFFAPLWRPDVDVHIWGPPSSQRSLENNLARFFSPPLFPVDIHDVPSRPTFHDVLDETIELDGVKLTSGYVKHSGPTVGYRLDSGDGVLAYIPDHEVGIEGPLSGLALADSATALIHNARYTAEEYANARGQGHSSIDDAVRFAKRVDAKHFFLFHHDPSRTDEGLDEMLDTAVRLWGDTPGGPQLAREGMEFKIAAQDISG